MTNKNLSRREFLGRSISAGAALSLAVSTRAMGKETPKPKGKPNILFILADDLGYGDVACYNPDSKIPTPNLDKLASEGMRFTDAHSPSTVCTPYRASLLTGQYPLSTGMFMNDLYLPSEELCMAEIFKTAGHDDVRIYNYALDMLEVIGLYLEVKPDETICLSNPPLDFTGPDGEPDCVVGLFDLALIASNGCSAVLYRIVFSGV